MDFITDRVAVGNSSDARHVFKDPQGITASLNCAVDLDIARPSGGAKIELHKVGMIDGPGNDPRMLQSAVLTLVGILHRHEKVLVHCHAGGSRSPVTTLLWLIVTGQARSWQEARDWLYKKRSVCGFNPELVRLSQEMAGRWLTEGRLL